MRKFRSLPKSSMRRIEHAERRLLNRINDARRHSPATPGKRLRLRNRALHHLRLLHHIAIFFFVSGGDAKQHPLKTRPPVAVRRRKISAAIERLAIRSQKRRERPSSLP